MLVGQLISNETVIRVATSHQPRILLVLVHKDTMLKRASNKMGVLNRSCSASWRCYVKLLWPSLPDSMSNSTSFTPKDNVSYHCSHWLLDELVMQRREAVSLFFLRLWVRVFWQVSVSRNIIFSVAFLASFLLPSEPWAQVTHVILSLLPNHSFLCNADPIFRVLGCRHQHRGHCCSHRRKPMSACGNQLACRVCHHYGW
jgi:hypothetical protein